MEHGSLNVSEMQLKMNLAQGVPRGFSVQWVPQGQLVATKEGTPGLQEPSPGGVPWQKDMQRDIFSVTIYFLSISSRKFPSGLGPVSSKAMFIVIKDRSFVC